MFRYCYALENFSSEGQQGAYVMPSTVTRIEEYAFNECKAVKYISVSPNVTYIGPAAFNTCSALEFVDFNGNQNDVDFNNWGTFMNCTNLKAVSMPDNTDYITNRMFSGCTNLMAVYLPSATVNIESNGYGAHTSFYCCYNLYFVNEQFEVRDENGLFYGDSFVQPTRPDVYYFPSKLEKIFDRNEGIGFASCYNLNPTMVFPETLKKFWINDGVFYECGKTGSKFTVVFLADMTDVRIGMRENRAKGVSYIFANAADTDLSCVNVIDTSPNYTPSFAGGEFMAFCASGKYFNLFNLGGSNDASQYTNDNVTYVTDENGSYVAKHLRNPKLDVTTPADCLNAKTVVTKCFCGCVLETVTEGEALGHNEGELIAVIYGDADKFFACGDHHYDCTRCDETVVKEDAAPIIFKVIGYAYTEAVNPSKAVMQAFAVNKVALNAYNDMTEDDIVGYGLVAANANVTEAFDNGVANINAVAQFQNTDYDVMEMKVTGLEGSNDVVGAFSGVKLHCCAYILTLNGENIDSYYATEVLNSEVSGVAIAVTDTLVADNAASYDDIFADRNP